MEWNKAQEKARSLQIMFLSFIRFSLCVYIIPLKFPSSSHKNLFISIFVSFFFFFFFYFHFFPQIQTENLYIFSLFDSISFFFSFFLFFKQYAFTYQKKIFYKCEEWKKSILLFLCVEWFLTMENIMILHDVWRWKITT